MEDIKAGRVYSADEVEEEMKMCIRDRMKKSHLDTSVYVLFTKADRKVENLINKRNTGDLYIDENTYRENIPVSYTHLDVYKRQS